MKLCKHEPHLVVDWILDPKWSTNEVLIDVDKVGKHENVLIRFANLSPQKKYGWFYMSGKMIRKHKTQPNGRGTVYVVPLSKREEFEPIKQCGHSD